MDVTFDKQFWNIKITINVGPTFDSAELKILLLLNHSIQIYQELS